MKIEVKDLKKCFGEKDVLKGISFEAESGEALGLLGRNGAGKTTTIRIIMGVFFQDSGEVFADGKPLDRNQISVGYLPEERGLYPKQLIGEQLTYFGVLRGLSRKQAVKNTERWLERMGMSEYRNKKLETLSKGNQQKIQLAATLLCDPELIILDEPFSGLDPVNAQLLKDVIREMIDKGAAVIFSSHQMNYIEEFCDRIAILNSGSIVLSGGIREIRRSYPRNVVEISCEKPQELSAAVAKSLSEQISETSVDEKNGILTVRMKNPEVKEALLKMIADCGADIDSFAVREPTLADIFVEYTGGGV